MGLLQGLAAGFASGAEAMSSQIEYEIKTERDQALEQARMKFADDLATQREQRNFDLEQKRVGERAAKAKEITGSVTDPMEGKGGYEDEASMAKRQYGLLQQRAAKLEEAGFIPEADRINKKLSDIDSKNSKDAQLEIKKMMLELQGQRIEDAAKYHTGLLGNAADKIKMQGEVNAAKIEAAQSKGAKETDSDKAYNSYVAEIKSQGKVPLSRYRFENWMENKKLNAKDSASETTATKTINDDGSETTKTVKGKPKLNVTPAGATSWEVYARKK